MAAMSGAWLRKKVRHPWLGGPRRLTMYLATLDCAISNPSLSSSPWMRGAAEQPHHSASLGDSIPASTQIRFSVHTASSGGRVLQARGQHEGRRVQGHDGPAVVKQAQALDHRN